jgi:hypothetical protein
MKFKQRLEPIKAIKNQNNYNKIQKNRVYFINLWYNKTKISKKLLCNN